MVSGMNNKSRVFFTWVSGICFIILILALSAGVIITAIGEASTIEKDAEIVRLTAAIEVLEAIEPKPLPLGGVEVNLNEIQTVIHPDDFIGFSSPYGIRRSPFSGDLVIHTGLDLYGTWHARIISPGDGVIIEHWVPPGQREGFKGHKDLGGCLVIQMDDGAIVTMGHLSETYVREGFRVLRGDVLGRQGSTGRSTGEHLHFAVSIDGETINPFGYFMEGM